MSLFQPKSQQKLTNVAYVRYKEDNKKFEIACYKNKVVSWRNGIEKDINEVLQIERVFTNVSKGIVASSKDLKEVFGTDDEKEVCRIILEKGDLQVSGKERNQQIDEKFKEIANIVYNKCVNIETKKPFPLAMIENAMKEIHFAINVNKSSKSQAIALIKELQAIMPIQRAQMKVRVDIPKEIGKKMKPQIEPLTVNIEKENFGINYQLICVIDPGNYREINDLVAKNTKGKGNVEVLDMAIQQLGDEQLL